MEVVKNIGLIIYILVCIAIIILATLQSEKHSGVSGTIMGNGAEGNFFEKNKGRTREGKMKRWTIILGIVFVVLSIVLGIIWTVSE